jgi:hypothetical protein
MHAVRQLQRVAPTCSSLPSTENCKAGAGSSTCLVCLVQGDQDLQLGIIPGAQYGAVAKAQEANFVQGITGIGDELTCKEHALIDWCSDHVWGL